ncbi:MAG: alpha-isopropylmalate synthase regulatory domain-containing protein, partial [Chthonomonadales bacterium]
VLKERTTYEIIDPKDVGIPESKIVLTARSGRHALQFRLGELGFHLNENQIDKVYERFLKVADQKKTVQNEDLEAIVADETTTVQVAYELVSVQVTAGDTLIPTATVELKNAEGTVFVDSAHGTGPVDAIYKAINRIICAENQLNEFSIQAVTKGIDSLADVTIRINQGDENYTGRGAHSDICVASARAYMHALNRLLDRKTRGSVQQGLVNV